MKSSQIKVSDIGEKGLIERIIERSKTCSDCRLDSNKDFSNFATSIGDDSALTNVPMYKFMISAGTGSTSSKVNTFTRVVTMFRSGVSKGK